MNSWHDLNLDEELIGLADEILISEGLSQMLNLGWKQMTLSMIVATDDKKFLSNIKDAIHQVGMDSFVDTLKKEHRKLFLGIVNKLEKNKDFVKSDKELKTLAHKLGANL